MTNNIIILGADDKVYTMSFDNYKDIQKAVKGNFEYFEEVKMSFRVGEIRNEASLDFICNDEFLFNENIQKYNALSDRIANHEGVYGDVAVLINEGDGYNRGFNEIETKIFTEMVENHVKEFGEKISKLHKNYDENKPEPMYQIY